MAASSPKEVTQLLLAWSEGDRAALDQSDTPGKAGGLMSGAASKAVALTN